MQIKNLVELDHHVSEYLLKLDNPYVTYFLLPFSSLFHPKMIWIPILTIYYLSSRSILDAIYYGLCMLVTLIFSTLMKRNFKRYIPIYLGKDLFSEGMSKNSSILEKKKKTFLFQVEIPFKLSFSPISYMKSMECTG